MKKVGIALMALVMPATAAVLTPTDVSKHIGETATVEGTANIYQARSGVTFVDLGGSGRSAPFTGVIFKEKVSAFPNITSYSGKTVDITGQIRLYRGKPEIILDSPDQLKAH